VVLFLLLFSLVLLYFGTPLPALTASLTKAGSVFFIISLFWIFFNKWGWRNKVVNLGGLLCDTPDLQGRWEGTVCRDGNGEEPHFFALEISQTFSNLKYRTFGEESRGESVSVVIVSKDDQSLMWEAICVWSSRAKSRTEPSKYEHFYGTSIWEISLDKSTNTKAIQDSYFTSRSTSGKIKVQYVSPTLKGQR
jgi:hypothetical protein